MNIKKEILKGMGEARKMKQSNYGCTLLLT